MGLPVVIKVGVARPGCKPCGMRQIRRMGVAAHGGCGILSTRAPGRPGARVRPERRCVAVALPPPWPGCEAADPCRKSAARMRV